VALVRNVLPSANLLRHAELARPDACIALRIGRGGGGDTGGRNPQGHLLVYAGEGGGLTTEI
jgi:hypothetical protein